VDRDRAITTILNELAEDGGSFDDLVPVVYDELRVLASSQLRRLRPGDTLDTTALVHEAYLKLCEADPRWESRRHFFATAAKVMRHLLVDAARRRSALKRGGDAPHLPLREDDTVLVQEAETVLAIDGALRSLAARSPRLARVVECRFFGGMDDAEVAQVLGVTERTIRRDWVKARAWLHQRLAGAESSVTD
jgi:RNA polymerase sigma factor (TIGR02999 family)